MSVIGFLGLLGAPSVDPNYAKNLTVYHINQINYTGLANMNSGDARGDLFFFLRSSISPVECEHDPSSHNCFNPEVVAGDLTATKAIIEVDSRFGTYAKCNVGPYCMCGRDPNNCPSGCSIPLGHYNCSCGEGQYMKCPGSVGREDPNATFGSRVRGSEDYEYWDANAARKIGGSWYTTVAGGECAPGEAQSKDCTWRVIQTVKRVAKSCLDASILRTVSNANQTCFSGCAQPSNLSTTCVTRCLFATVLGPAGGSSLWNEGDGGLNQQALLEAWESPFESSDPASGGCPAV